MAAACYLSTVTRDPLTGETFARVVGRRQRPAFGAAPSLEAQAAHTSMLQYRTRAPKGVFIYRTHEEMAYDQVCAGRSRPWSSAPVAAEVTRPATWEDVKTLARLLADAGVRWALIGGYAIAAHGFVRLSEDVDILVDPSRENTRRWIDALTRLPDGATRELVGEDDLFEREGPYAVRVNDEFTVDVMPSACGHPWAVLAPYIEQRDVGGLVMPVLGLEGLLLTKEGARDKDRADAAVLRRALEALKL